MPVRNRQSQEQMQIPQTGEKAGAPGSCPELTDRPVLIAVLSGPITLQVLDCACRDPEAKLPLSAACADCAVEGRCWSPGPGLSGPAGHCSLLGRDLASSSPAEGGPQPSSSVPHSPTKLCRCSADQQHSPEG